MGLSRQRGRVFPGPPLDVASVLKLLPPQAQTMALDLPPPDREVLAHLVARNCSSPPLDLIKNSSKKKQQQQPLVGPLCLADRSPVSLSSFGVCDDPAGAHGSFFAADENPDFDRHLGFHGGSSGADQHSGVHGGSSGTDQHSGVDRRRSPVADQQHPGAHGSLVVGGSSRVVLDTGVNGSSAQHRPSLFCACFHCYSVFWRRWNSSPHHCLINDILDLLDDHLMASSGPPYASLRATSIDDSIAAKKKKRKKKKKKTVRKKEEEEEEEEKKDGQEKQKEEVNEEGEEEASDRLDDLSWKKGGVGSSLMVTCGGDNHGQGYGRTDAPPTLEEQEERQNYAVFPVYESSEGGIDLLEEEEDNPNSDRSSSKDPKSSFLTRVFFPSTITTAAATTTSATTSTSTSLEGPGLAQRLWEMFSFRGGKKMERA